MINFVVVKEKAFKMENLLQSAEQERLELKKLNTQLECQLKQQLKAKEQELTGKYQQLQQQVGVCNNNEQMKIILAQYFEIFQISSSGKIL